MARKASRSQALNIAKAVARRLGFEAQARQFVATRTAAGRRGLRDDRQLAFFMAAILHDSSNCVDVGAHAGAVLREIVRLAPNGHHLAFEPIPDFAQALGADFPTVEVRDCALSDSVGEATFHVADPPALSGIQQREWLNTDYKSITVPVRTLDSAIPADLHIDFLKIDVEGAQVRVLRGADRILATDHPAIWVEHGSGSAEVYNTTSRELWELLTGHGYRIWTADGDGPLDLPAFLETDNNKLMWTFMAHC